MERMSDVQLTQEQKEAVAKQLADFFFAYWQKRITGLPQKEPTNLTIGKTGNLPLNKAKINFTKDSNNYIINKNNK